jgi:hypothetical protein
MRVLIGAFFAAALSASPALVLAADHGASPCGWKGGALADPAATHQCLAERFKAAKSKTPPAQNTPSSPAKGPSNQG